MLIAQLLKIIAAPLGGDLGRCGQWDEEGVEGNTVCIREFHSLPVPAPSLGLSGAH